MVYIDGMVGRLVQLVQDAHLATCLRGSREDSIAKLIFGNNLAATESKENSARLDLFKGFVIETGITLQSIVECAAVLGKGRRIKDDEVVGTTGFLQKFESIAAISLMARVTGEIEFNILFGEFDGFGTAVDRMDQGSLTAHGIEREAARVTEHIEYFPAAGILFEQAAVFALVDEEACLLATQPIDMKEQSVFGGGIVMALAIEESVFLSEVGFERQGCFTLVKDMVDTTAHHLFQTTCYLYARHVHTHTVCLHHGRFAIAVDDKSGKVVSLAMNESEGIVVCHIGQTDGTTHLQGGIEATEPESIIDDNLFKSKHADSYRADLVMAHTDMFTLMTYYRDDFALFDGIIGFENGT